MGTFTAFRFDIFIYLFCSLFNKSAILFFLDAETKHFSQSCSFLSAFHLLSKDPDGVAGFVRSFTDGSLALPADILRSFRVGMKQQKDWKS